MISWIYTVQLLWSNKLYSIFESTSQESYYTSVTTS